MSDDKTPDGPTRAAIKNGTIMALNRTIAGIVQPVAMLRDGLRLAQDKGLAEAMPEAAGDVNHGLLVLGKRIEAVDEAVRALAEACVKAHEEAKEVHGKLPALLQTAIDTAVQQARREFTLQAALAGTAAEVAAKGGASGLVIAS